MLKLALDNAAPNGALPTWMISATLIGQKFGVSEKVGQEATRINMQHIKINPYLPGRNEVALLKKPGRA